MRLVADASSLVAEALRVRGRELIAHPGLELFIAEEVRSETEYELGHRVAAVAQRGLLSPAAAKELQTKALRAITTNVTVVPKNSYGNRFADAVRRMPRDPDDAPTVALALALGCAIWTNDRDFFGCGLPVWTTETLLRYLESDDEAR